MKWSKLEPVKQTYTEYYLAVGLTVHSTFIYMYYNCLIQHHMTTYTTNTYWIYV